MLDIKFNCTDCDKGVVCIYKRAAMPDAVGRLETDIILDSCPEVLEITIGCSEYKAIPTLTYKSFGEPQILR